MNHLLVLAMVLVNGTSARAMVVPSDFSLVLVGGPCSGDSFDTSKGRYERFVKKGQYARTRVTLTPGLRQRLFDLATEVGLSEYPTRFEPPSQWIRIPFPSFAITVRADGKRHTVHWDDMGSEVPDAMRLRRFIADVYAEFAQLPEVQRLPKQQEFCL